MTPTPRRSSVGSAVLCVAIALFALPMLGCMRSRPLPSGGPLPPKALLRITLLDGTTFDLEGARAESCSRSGPLEPESRGGLRGTPKRCSGASCTRILTARCVDDEEVAKVAELEAHPLGIAVGIGGIAVVLVAFLYATTAPLHAVR
jgi:hypothetical protein